MHIRFLGGLCGSSWMDSSFNISVTMVSSFWSICLVCLHLSSANETISTVVASSLPSPSFCRWPLLSAFSAPPLLRLIVLFRSLQIWAQWSFSSSCHLVRSSVCAPPSGFPNKINDDVVSERWEKEHVCQTATVERQKKGTSQTPPVAVKEVGEKSAPEAKAATRRRLAGTFFISVSFRFSCLSFFNLFIFRLFFFVSLLFIWGNCFPFFTFTFLRRLQCVFSGTRARHHKGPCGCAAAAGGYGT